MITIDGAARSGSGTIVRYSVALASLLGKEIRVENIRAGRDKPGLRAILKWCRPARRCAMAWWTMLRWALKRLPTHPEEGSMEESIAGI